MYCQHFTVCQGENSLRPIGCDNRTVSVPLPGSLKLLPHAKRVCEAYETLQMEVDDLSGLQSGMIRIGTFSSVATHWLPNMIREFQKDYPHIDYELLLGDYEEIEAWIAEGRVDFGFLRLPTRPDFETILLAEDPHMAVLPENHPLAAAKTVSLSALQKEPFILLERSGKADVSRIFQENGLNPNVRFTTWDDYAIMSMVENGLGLSILPRLILQRVPYRIAVRPLDVPACRSIGLAMRNRAHLPLAAKRFLDYLPCRDTPSVDNPALSY